MLALRGKISVCGEKGQRLKSDGAWINMGGGPCRDGVQDTRQHMHARLTKKRTADPTRGGLTSWHTHSHTNEQSRLELSHTDK